MNKKWLFVIILVPTILTITLIIIHKSFVKSNKLIINSNTWNEIISKRNMSTSISLDSIAFNNYNLFIDNTNNFIYYSVVNSKNKYNPLVDYKLNSKNLKIGINDKISDEALEQDNLKIIVYNDNSYRMYTLVVTNYPILNVIYTGKENKKHKVDVEVELFDNHLDSRQKVLKTKGILKKINNIEEYNLSLIKNSLGNNERDNFISIFGMDKESEYILKKADNSENSVRFFINNEYIGLFNIKQNKERSVDNFERNKENNR